MERDLRDPKKMGEVMDTLRRKFPHLKPSIRADMLVLEEIDPYPGDESMVTLTAATRQQELRDRAARGDKYAISMLNGEAYHEPSDGE